MSFRIKTHLGLGDAVYSYSVVKYLLKKHHDITVLTKYPIVFSNLPVKTETIFDKRYDLFLKYTDKRHKSTTQFEDICESAGITERIPFRLDWKINFSSEFKENYFDYISKSGKKICVIKEPCAAHMDKLSNSFRMAPASQKVQDFINRNRNDFFFVSVGLNDKYQQRLENINLDLNDKISLSDFITLVKYSDAVATQIGHLVPLAQAFNKKLTIFEPATKTRVRVEKVAKIYSV